MASSRTATNTLTAKPEDKKSGKPKPEPIPAPDVWESRAIIKLIEAGSQAECPVCNERVKFRARHRDQQVICNVYEDGAWKRVEHYHLECYVEADSPYGEAVKP